MSHRNKGGKGERKERRKEKLEHSRREGADHYGLGLVAMTASRSPAQGSQCGVGLDMKAEALTPVSYCAVPLQQGPSFAYVSNRVFLV